VLVSAPATAVARGAPTTPTPDAPRVSRPSARPSVGDTQTPPTWANDQSGQVIRGFINGRLSRLENLQTGEEYVVAYDKTGRAHYFKDQPVRWLNVGQREIDRQIPAWRRQQLEGTAKRLINRYGGGAPNKSFKPKLNFRDFGQMVREIASWANLTELEKAYTWSCVMRLKGDPKGLSGAFTSGYYRISLDGLPNSVRDSDPGRESNSPAHVLIDLMYDSYHGQLANLSFADAVATIRDHEGNLVGDIPRPGGQVNPGDINASTATVRAEQALLKGGFVEFARVWCEQFVE
jgi:hypothetical protein